MPFSAGDLSAVVLSTDRLRLRPFEAADAPQITAAMTDPVLQRFLDVPDPYTGRDAELFLAAAAEQRRAGTALECALVEHGSHRLVGTAALFLPSGRSVAGEIGYALYPGGRGRGYATEAARALATWGLRTGLPRLEIRTVVTNTASQRVALAAGFAFESVARGGLRATAADTEGDAAVFSRLPADPGDPRAPALPLLSAGGLGDGTVTVRPLTARDVALVLADAREPSTRRWAVGALASVDERRLRANTRQAELDWLVGRHFRMVIADAATGAAAGTVSMHPAGPSGTALIGYSLLPQWRGRRYATRALRLLASWAFTDAGLTYLELGTDVDNVASQRTAEAAGFQLVGISEGYLPRADGSFADERHYGLSLRRWRAAGGASPVAEAQ